MDYKREIVFYLLASWCILNIKCSLSISQSNACFSDGYCGFHDLRCAKNERLAIKSATHGFKPRSKTCPFTAGGTDCLTLNTTFCCSEEKDRDCTLSYHENDLKDVFEKCSGKSFCRLQPSIVKDSCYSISQSETASFSVIEYGCVDDTTIVKMCTDDVALGNELSTVYKPNGFSLLYDRGCQCSLESLTADVEAPVYVYVMDVRFTESLVSACYSELRLTKQRKVVGSVRSPKSRELGFLHSFVPVVNLTTPVDIDLFISKEALPEYVWLRFEAPIHQVMLKCRQAEEIEVALCKKEGAASTNAKSDNGVWQTTATTDTSSKPPSDIVDIMLATMLIVLSKKASVIAGGTAAICLLICAIIFGVFYYRKKKLKTLQTVDFVPRIDIAGQPKYRMRRKCSISRLGTSGPLKLVKSIWPDSSDADTSDKEQQVKRVNRKSILEIITGLRKIPQHNIQLSANDFQLKQNAAKQTTTECQTSTETATAAATTESKTSRRTSFKCSTNGDSLVENARRNLKPVANQNNLQQISAKDLDQNNTHTVYVQCDLHNPYLSLRRTRNVLRDNASETPETVEQYAQVTNRDIIHDTIKEEDEEENKVKKKRSKFQTFPRIFMRYFDSSIEDVDGVLPDGDIPSSLCDVHDAHREKTNKKRDLSNFLNMFKKTDDSTQIHTTGEKTKPTPAKRKIKYPPKPAMPSTPSQVRLTETQEINEGEGEEGGGEGEGEGPERPPPPRPPKMPLRNPKKLVNDVYTQVVNIRKEAKLRKQSNMAATVEHCTPGTSAGCPRARNHSLAQDSCFYRNDYMPPLRSTQRGCDDVTEVYGFYEPINVPTEEEIPTTYHRLETPRNSQLRGTKMITTFFNTVKNFKLK